MTSGKAPLEILRSQGWTVAVHNDYRLNGAPATFWLFTHQDDFWIKGEGPTDEAALAGLPARAYQLLLEGRTIQEWRSERDLLVAALELIASRPEEGPARLAMSALAAVEKL